MTEIYLVRHGETEENVQHILQGHLPGTLTERGIAQAEALCDELVSLETHFDAVVSSDLLRAVRTAEIINRPFALPFQTTPLLRERDWGTLTGKVVTPETHVDIPDSAESVEAMFLRAGQFQQWVGREYAGKRVIAVSHGLFNRVVQAYLKGVTIRDIPRMENAEVRILQIGEASQAAPTDEQNATDSVSAN